MSKMSHHAGRVCERLAPGVIAPAKQRQVAALAYKFWIARCFQNGSPQEDWLEAVRTVYPDYLGA